MEDTIDKLWKTYQYDKPENDEHVVVQSLISVGNVNIVAKYHGVYNSKLKRITLDKDSPHTKENGIKSCDRADTWCNYDQYTKIIKDFKKYRRDQIKQSKKRK